MTIGKQLAWGGLVIVLVVSFVAVLLPAQGEPPLSGFSNVRGFATRSLTGTAPILTYDFGVIDMPTERAGAASSSTGFEFGKLLPTSVTAITFASTSTGFAVTMNKAGKVRGCAFNLQTVPTTGTVSIMIQKNGTLQTTKYCKLPASATFATQGQINDMSTNEVIPSSDITFVAGDQLGLIASTSNLNAATFDGWAKLIVELNN